ncbi:NUDIX domain-containing protein [Caulobacter sp. SLTY]|uniref:NUDIX domain-containing protein n=1 Tax=Caulobacter sp. SLTY TaxID=2683262 RepID=UPI0014130383|nr:NUDIX domain-containing protein [Caulobacter sp. SLTY]NBB15500.1 NUDIX domain-containing protein [Caulobacter sp. SLTY]
MTTPPPEPRLGVGAAIVRDGRLLLFRRLREPEAGKFSIPGGKIDLGEATEAGLRREVLEETGLTIGALSLLCVVDLIDPAGGFHWVSPTYLAVEAEGEAVLMEPEKHADLGWYPLNALPTPLSAAAEAVRNALKTPVTGSSPAE